MSAATSAVRSPRSAFRLLAGLVTVALFAAGCGDDSSADPATGAGPFDDGGGDTAATPSDDSPGIVDFDDFPVVGDDGYQGPDWMEPSMLVLLPNGLTVTIDFEEAETGRAELTGFVTDGDIDGLFGDAKFMVRADGFFPIDDVVSGASRSFSARIGPTGEQILFGVTDIGGGTLQWSMEFSNSELEATFEDVLEDAGVETGAQATVKIGESEWEIPGGCENGDFIGIADGASLSVGFSEAGEPVGTFSDPGEGSALLVPTMTPVTDYDVGADGFSMYGEFEGIEWSIEARCAR